MLTGAVSTPLGPLPASFVNSAVDVSRTFKETILNIGGFLVGVDDEVVA